jgi:hypothetical protein
VAISPLSCQISQNDSAQAIMRILEVRFPDHNGRKFLKISLKR